MSSGSLNGECEVLIMSRCSSGNKSSRAGQVAGCGQTLPSLTGSYGAFTADQVS